MKSYNKTEIAQKLDTYILQNDPKCTKQQFLDKLENLYGGEIIQITANKNTKWRDSSLIPGTLLHCLISIAFTGTCGSVIFTEVNLKMQKALDELTSVNNKKLKSGHMAGIVLGSTAVAALAAVGGRFIYKLHQRHKLKRKALMTWYNTAPPTFNLEQAELIKNHDTNQTSTPEQCHAYEQFELYNSQYLKFISIAETAVDMNKTAVDMNEIPNSPNIRHALLEDADADFSNNENKSPVLLHINDKDITIQEIINSIDEATEYFKSIMNIINKQIEFRNSQLLNPLTNAFTENHISPIQLRDVLYNPSDDSSNPWKAWGHEGHIIILDHNADMGFTISNSHHHIIRYITIFKTKYNLHSTLDKWLKKIPTVPYSM